MSRHQQISDRSRAMASAAAIAALSVFASPPAKAESSLSTLAGSWTGGGQLRLDDGRSERLACRANYSPRNGGSGLGMSIRCASQSYKIELRSSMTVDGGRVSGTWEERSFNAGGSLAGRAAAGQLNVAFSGSMTGSLNVSFGGSSQRVSIRSGGGSGFSLVSLNLSRG